jgi:ankyrin repeat protein
LCATQPAPQTQDSGGNWGWLIATDGGDFMSMTQLHRAADNCDVSEVRALVSSNPKIVHDRDAEGNTPLRLTVSIEVAKILLGAGADVNTANDDGLTPLHKAAFCYNAGLAGLYLDHGAHVDAQNKKGITPLISAAMAGNDYEMALLLVHGADPCHIDRRGISAINENQGVLMRDLCLLVGALKKTAMDAIDNEIKKQATALHTALLTALAQVLKPFTPPGDIVLSPSGRGVLEAWKQAVSAQCRSLRSAVPLFAQSYAKDLPKAWQVVEQSQRVLEEQHGPTGSQMVPASTPDTPPPAPAPAVSMPAEPVVATEPAEKTLEFACSACKGKLRAKASLCGKRVKCPKCKGIVAVPQSAINIRCENPDCQMPLRVKDELAGKRIKCPACGHLMVAPAQGGQPASAAAKNRTPSQKDLHLAAEQGKIDEVQSLLGQGADVDAKNSDGATPLHRALFGSFQARGSEGDRRRYLELIRLLLENGADVRTEDNQGRDALQWALMATNDEAARMIENKMGLRRLS